MAYVAGIEEGREKKYLIDKYGSRKKKKKTNKTKKKEKIGRE